MDALEELRSKLPESLAQPAKGRESLELVFKGENFEWVEKANEEKNSRNEIFKN